MKKRYFIIASIFLFNPLVSIIDIFPDFIGYLLILYALRKQAYSDEKAEDASRGLKIMSLISSLKLVALLLIPTLGQSMFLVFSAVFGILESIYGISMFAKLFDCTSVYALLDGNKKCANNAGIKAFTQLALVFRLILAFLPDLTFLSNSEGQMPLSSFRPVLFVVSVFISLVVGTVWLVLSIRHFNRFATASLNAILKEKYFENYEKRDSLFVAKDYLSFLFFVCIGCVFTLDFNLDSINRVPDSIFTTIIALSFVYLFVKKRYKNIIVLITVCVGSVAHIAVEAYLRATADSFFEKYSLSSIERISKAEDIYFKMCALSAISALIFAAIVVVTIIAVRNSARRELEQYAHLFVGTDKSYMLEELDTESRKQAIVAFVFTGLCSASYAEYMLIRHKALISGTLNTVMELAFVFVFIKLMLYFYDNVFKRILTHS